MELAFLASMAQSTMNVIGSFYEAKSRQYMLRSQAVAADYEGSMADLNARQAELDAQSVLRSGQERAGVRGMQLAQDLATTKVSQAAAGVNLGVGSAAEVRASEQLAARIDMMRIGVDAARGAGERRMVAADQLNRAEAARLQGRLLRRQASAINPWRSAALTLINSSGQLASAWAQGQSGDYYGPRSRGND